MSRALMCLFLLAVLSACTVDYASRCKEYGYKPETDAFAKCVQNKPIRTPQSIGSVNSAIQRSHDNSANYIYSAPSRNGLVCRLVRAPAVCY